MGCPFSAETGITKKCFLPTIELWHCRSLCTTVPIQHRRFASTIYGWKLAGLQNAIVLLLVLTAPYLFDSLGPWREDRRDTLRASNACHGKVSERDYA